MRIIFDENDKGEVTSKNHFLLEQFDEFVIVVISKCGRAQTISSMGELESLESMIKASELLHRKIRRGKALEN